MSAYPVIVEKTGYSAHTPDLPGVATLQQMKEVIPFHIQGLNSVAI